MAQATVLFREDYEKLAVVSPVSSAIAVNSAWVDAANFDSIVAEILVGVIAATGTFNAKLEQATDSGGTGAKDITGTAITQMVATTDNNEEIDIEIETSSLDVDNGFRFVRLVLTPATAASLIAAVLLGKNKGHRPVTNTWDQYLNV